jgi:hypothetical protein
MTFAATTDLIGGARAAASPASTITMHLSDGSIARSGDKGQICLKISDLCTAMNSLSPHSLMIVYFALGNARNGRLVICLTTFSKGGTSDARNSAFLRRCSGGTWDAL